jgi:hypothetical protein
VPFFPSPPLLDAVGNIYGTNPDSVFELVRINSDSVRRVQLAVSGNCNVRPGCPKTKFPLVTDNKGNLFGTATISGHLTIFEVNSGGMKTIYNDFASSCCGGLAIDNFDNLYGVVLTGGLGFGGIYQLSPSGTYKLIFGFLSNHAGIAPVTPIYDGAGNLYVETPGDIVRLRMSPNGDWNGVVLAKNPIPVSWQLGHDGALYMLTQGDEIIRLAPQPGRIHWQSTVLIRHATPIPGPIALDFENFVYVPGTSSAVQYSPPPSGGTPWKSRLVDCSYCRLGAGPDGNIYGITSSHAIEIVVP